MTDTPNLALPLLAAAQAQKHVTHNEALLVLDALVNCAVIDRDLAAPPGAAADGARYIVAGGGSGAWAGQGGRLAVRESGAWRFYDPHAGLVALIVDEGVLLVHDGSGWKPATGSVLANLTRLGIGTAADAGNPFAAKLNAALWTAKPASEGGTGHLRYTLNKDGASSVLSLLFQSGYSGRAEFGLVGDDDLQVKVSADGSAWTEAVRVKGDGRVGIGTASPSDRLSVAGTIAPASDNSYSLGTAARRVSTVYAATGTINTSDIRLKRDVEAIDPGRALSIAEEAAPIAFRWIEGGSEPGLDGLLEPRPGRRRHLGWSAQAWRDALAGEDAGLLVLTDPQDPDSTLGVRPDQITAVLHAALIGLARRMRSVEAALQRET